MFYLTTHSTHFIYGYLEGRVLFNNTQRILFSYLEGRILFNDALNTFCLHILLSYLEGSKEVFYLTTHSTFLFTVIWKEGNVLFNALYASSHREDDTYHSLCYISRGGLARTRNSS